MYIRESSLSISSLPRRWKRVYTYTYIRIVGMQQWHYKATQGRVCGRRFSQNISDRRQGIIAAKSPENTLVYRVEWCDRDLSTSLWSEKPQWHLILRCAIDVKHPIEILFLIRIHRLDLDVIWFHSQIIHHDSRFSITRHNPVKWESKEGLF